MHVHISWCYKSSFVNISRQFVCFCCCCFFFTLGFCRCYLQLVMWRYMYIKKTSEKVGLWLTLSLFGNFIVTPSNTVEPRYNDPRYNDIPGITINMLWPGKSYSEMYRTEPRYNDLRCNDIPDITMSF